MPQSALTSRECVQRFAARLAAYADAESGWLWCVEMVMMVVRET